MTRVVGRVTLAAFLLLPGTALAWHHGLPDGAGQPPTASHRPRACCLQHRPSAPPFVSPFPRSALFGLPIGYTSPAPVYAPDPIVYPLVPMAYATEPPLTDVAPPPTPPVEPAREIVFPTGRWELHGDGVSYAHVWVWVPMHHAGFPAGSTEPAPPTAAPPANR